MPALPDPVVLLPLLALLLLSLPRTVVYVITWVVCLFSRDRARRAEARRLLHIIGRSDRDRPSS